MADETVELFSITNKLTLDTSQFDRAYREVHGKVRTLGGEVNKLETAMKSGGGGTASFGASLQGLVPSLSALGGPAGAIGIVTAGIGLYAAAITGASALTWELTKRFSDIGSELQDMADQVNFTTETLGTFQGIGKSVGVEVESLSGGLVKFQTNLLKGNDALKALGVTSKDNETALRETFKALSEVTDATTQSALAAEIFGARGGKSMLAMIKATNGNLDEATDKLRKWNVLMSDQAVAIADEFGDKLAELGMRFQGIGNTIATETAPAFISAFDQIGAALDASTIEWKWWGTQIGNVIVGASGVIAGFLKAVQSMSITGGPGAFIMVWKQGMDQAIAEMNAKRGELLAPMPEGSGGGRVPGRTVDWSPGGTSKGKKGKSEAEREAERERRELERLQEQRVNMIEKLNLEYKRLSEELKGVDTNTRSYAVAESQLTGILKGASPELIKQAEAIAKATDNREKQLRLQNELKAFMTTMDAAVKTAIEGEKNHTQQAAEFIASLERQGAVLSDNTKHWIKWNALLLDSNENIKKLAENMEKVTEAFPLPPIIFPTTPESEIPDRAGEAANREMGLPPEMRESPLLKWRRVADGLARDITYTIDNAIRRGFEDGIGAGVKAFGLGLLEMARDAALDELQRVIAKALRGGSEEGESGGGGWLSKLVGFGVSAIGGLFGGGGASAGGTGSAAGSGIGNFATGGFMFPNTWALVGERGPELIKAGPRGASVMSNQETAGMYGGGGMVVNQTIQVPSMYMAGNRQTQTQALRGLQQAAQRGSTLRG